MLIALALALLLALDALRRVVDPACPSCAAKRWSSAPGILSCTRCGWSNVATNQPVAELVPVQPTRPTQYEIAFH